LIQEIGANEAAANAELGTKLTLEIQMIRLTNDWMDLTQVVLQQPNYEDWNDSENSNDVSKATVALSQPNPLSNRNFQLCD
jgi:hypothetical protein